MSFNHEAVSALPVSTAADKALIRAMVTRRSIYCFDPTENVADFVAVDPATGIVPLFVIQNSILFQYDSADSTTPADGVTCVVSSEGKRFKVDTLTSFIGSLAFSDINGVAAPSQLPLDTDGTLTADSDLTIATQKAVKTYVDNIVAITDAMVFKGVIDCSANPNYPTADRGWTYRVSVAGKIGGVSGSNVDVGDLLICLTDGTLTGTQAGVGTSWTITQANIDGAVVGPASVTDDLPAVFDGTTGKLIKSKTYAAFKTLLILVKGDVGLGNVDNTSDANKPVSTAQQTALDSKANLASPTFTGAPAGPTAATGTNTTQFATTAFVKAAVDVVLGGVSAAFDTLSEIAADLGSKALKTITLTAGSGLTGGGDLSVNRSFAVSDIDTAHFAANIVDTDSTMAANSDLRLPSQKAVKSAIAASVSGVSSFNGATGAVVYQAGMHNRLINPSGQIWQRQNSGAAAITDGTYAFDRWYGLTQTAGITASQVTNAENGTPFMMRLSQANAVAQRFGLSQLIESLNCLDLRGQAVALSARVRMSASTTIRYAIIEWTGTADTVTKDFVNDWTNGTFTAGQFFTATNTTVTATDSVALTANTLTSISLLATLGSATNNVAVIFWTDSTQAQNVTLDISKAQFEVGAVATPIAVRSFSAELADCQRYYEKSYLLGIAPGSVATADAQRYWSGSTVTEWFTPFKQLKFSTAPAVTVYSGNTGASGNIRDVSSGADVAATGASAGAQGFNVSKTTAGTSGFRYDAHWTAGGEL